MLVTFSSSPDWYHFGPSATTKPGRRHIGQNLAAHRAATASAKVAGRSILPKNDKIIVDLLRKSEVYMVHPGPLRDVRDRHDALGRDAMDAASVRQFTAGRERKRRTAKSCGPGAATVASILREVSRRQR